ncbi:GlcNAc-PI de-N-acetylase [bacterium A37T11]|nr:GlcNAc-PI de-N-acetylase [bacterium A37T11]
MDKRYALLIWMTFSQLLKLSAQPSPIMDASAIKAGMEKLGTLGNVLYFAAHPDDENTRLITWLANEKHYRTAYFSLTRGDGGQNLIGSEQGEELGLIRTQELLAARRMDGGEQYFSRAIDFGFSKTAEETLNNWNKEQVLADAVWVIRLLHPDVIITRFPPDSRAGHGHHQASAILAKEAFVAAADPKRFPEQLAFVKPWQAKRLLWNTFSYGIINTSNFNQLKLEIGQYNPLLGKSYGEIAAESRSNHRTQGFGSEKQRGSETEYFQTLLGQAPTSSLMDGVDTTWNRIKGGDLITDLIDKINMDFDMRHPEKSIQALIDLLNKVESLDDTYWKAQKASEIKNLILACGGVWIESYAPAPRFALGETIQITTQFIVRNPNVRVEIQQLSNSVLQTEESGSGSTVLKFNEMTEQHSTFHAEELTQPYWLSLPHSRGTYVVNRQQDRTLPENRTTPKMFIRLAINGKSLVFERSVSYKFADPAKGEIYVPLSISPALTVNLSQKALIFKGEEPRKLEAVITAQRDGVKAMVRAVVPEGWRADPESIDLDLKRRGEEMDKVFTIYPAKDVSVTDSMVFEITESGQTVQAKAIHNIVYDHIPAITWFPESKLRLSKIDAVVTVKRIGYLAGAGDLVAPSLRELGIQVDDLSEETILKKDLSMYDAIVTGVRLYNINDRMRLLQPHLLEYVNNGGTLLVQYNVNSRLTLNKIGPYPFSIGRDRVTEEDAEVEITDASNQALNYPNKIKATDFEGWTQERGLYFVEEVDSHYQQPLQMHDTGERPNKGSLVITPYGKGKFVYTSLAFFRELPAGVPGAYRLFINLLAKEQKK